MRGVCTVLEELDYPTEFFLDSDTSTLYYVTNSSSPTAAPVGDFVAPQLQVLFNVSGTLAAPVRNFSLRDVKVTAAATTILAPHGVPSGGDWGLERMAALFFQVRARTASCVQ